MNARNLFRFAALLGTLVAPRVMAQPPARFSTAPSYAAGANPVSLAVADFNGDGHADLVLANHTAQGTVSVLLGNGDGTFQAAQSYAAGADPVSVAVGDFNGDGRPDVVVVNYADQGTVSILLGNGDGTFQPPQSYPVGDQPQYVAVADFNGDGIPDLAVAVAGILSAPPTVSVLLGKGDGTFQPAQSYIVGTSAASAVFLAIGDFNGDGFSDIAVAKPGNLDVASSGVTILLNKGDGTFRVGQDYGFGFPARAVAAADFDSDGRLDLAVAGGFDSLVILLGQGDGSFHAGQSYVAQGDPAFLVVGDFNGDGKLDLATGSYGVAVFLGKGDGTFQAAQTYTDVNGDGIPDLVVANYGYGYNGSNGSVSVLLGNSDGTFRAAISFPAGSGPAFVAVGDFNGDGKVDIVTTNFSQSCDPRHPTICWTIESDVRIYLGNGDGTFQAGEVYSQARPVSVAVGDFNGDGILDLAVGNDPDLTGHGFGLSILLGNGDGTFQAGQSYTILAAAVAAGDFNADGRFDLALANGSSFTGEVNVLFGNGDGTFQGAQSYGVGRAPITIAVGDFNDDGIPDLVVANNPDGTVSVLLGAGDGTFRAAQSFLAGGGPASLAVGDFNRDGLPDLAVIAGGCVTILVNAAGWDR